ncbi:peroxiredoxin [Palleronia caenipelagi]|uniref:Glutathione-dependent peroxiredoxin n=1 Tax=Palleronia caenipelagi TaxID=2489174 RepID=A0A547Q6I4_9RHOB|nr:peroxiredoxin [Palleronia caenipelagi]TRD21992.1 peroxiredoxin [Palleronia caenipelagi]
MAIKTGDRLPDATFLIFDDESGPGEVQLREKLEGRKVVIFGLPGAYTRTCTAAHMPSFVRNADALREKGIDEIICISVNDPFVLAQWGKDTGAAEAGITILGDSAAEYSKAIGMSFTAPPVGFYDRSKRYAMVVEDGVVLTLDEDEPGTCNTSGGEYILSTL